MKQKMSLSIEQKHARHLQRCAQRSTDGNISAYIERLLAEDEMRQAVTAAARWYTAHPYYAEDSVAEAQATLGETA
ncbi:MAG TPA: hypothetical protein VGM60_03175 [Pseudonocardia sp.]|uniref:hypothetical protein n=1 Tax=Pseudonocardia sp. TaxID=60912 RepID=UPI002F3F3C5B